MNKSEFGRARDFLGKTQKQMAELFGTSLKAIQSFEQGWRNIPVHIERQVLFLLALQKTHKRNKPCWALRKCPEETRGNCPAWEFRGGHLCWFIDGTICHGEVQESWEKKMTVCRECKVFRSMFPPL